MISLKKIKKILENEDLIVEKYYIYNNLVNYIKVYNIAYNINFLVKFPIKYNISIKDKQEISGVNIVKLKTVEKFKSSADQYSSEQENIDTYTTYNTSENEECEEEDKYEFQENYEVNNFVKQNYVDHFEEDVNIKENIQEKMKKNYRTTNITTQNSSYDKSLKNIYNQLSRLIYSTEKIDYKISIENHKYFCLINENNIIENYSITDISNDDDSDDYSVNIIIRFSKFCEVKDKSYTEIKKFYSNIFNLLKYNKNKHIKNKIKLYKELTELENLIPDINKKYDKIQKKFNYYEKSLRDIVQIEKSIEKKYSRLKNRKIAEDNLKQKKLQIKQKLDEIYKYKLNLYSNIKKLSREYQNFILSVDTILFDNTILVFELLKNMNKIKILIN